MALFQPKPKVVSEQQIQSNNIASKIQQRRYQMLVHSLLYYELDFSLVSDDQWAKWALELVNLQQQNPEVAETVIFANAFKNFDGSTGFDLPYRDEQIVTIARRLLKSSNLPGAKSAIDRLSMVVSTSAEYSGFNKKTSSQPIKQVSQPQRKVATKNEPVKRKKLF